MILHGFEVETNSKIVPDYILMNMDRRDVMLSQITMSYREYMGWKLEVVREQFGKLCERCWKGRTPDQTEMMNYYTKVIELTDSILEEIKIIDNLEIEKEEL